MAIIQEISEYLQKGRAKNVKALVQQALDEGMDPKQILNEGLLDGMMIIGGKFKRNEIFVPEVLVAARALNAGLNILEPKLVEVGNEPVGRAVVGTVRGDLHDIGKNLVVMMLKGAGFEICDMGVDVAPEAFIDKAEEIHADVICMSALLTTTMTNMEDVITELKKPQSAGQIHRYGWRSPGKRQLRAADRRGLLYAGCRYRSGSSQKSGSGKSRIIYWK